MEVQELFDRAFARLRGEEPDLGEGRMFGSHGVKTGDKFFAFVVEGDFVVKIPAARVAELVASGDGLPFPKGDRRPIMKEWVRLRPADEEACYAYMREALDFVAAEAARRRATR